MYAAVRGQRVAKRIEHTETGNKYLRVIPARVAHVRCSAAARIERFARANLIARAGLIYVFVAESGGEYPVTVGNAIIEKRRQRLRLLDSVTGVSKQTEIVQHQVAALLAVGAVAL